MYLDTDCSWTSSGPDRGQRPPETADVRVDTKVVNFLGSCYVFGPPVHFSELILLNTVWLLLMIYSFIPISVMIWVVR